MSWLFGSFGIFRDTFIGLLTPLFTSHTSVQLRLSWLSTFSVAVVAMGTPINIDLTRDILFSDLAQDNWIPPPLTDALDIIAFHQGLHGYERTPLRPLPGVASLLGVRAVYLKDETERFGLPSFKFLGVSWATFRILCKRLGLPTSADVATMRRALGGAACVMDDGYGTINAATPGYSNGAYDRVRVTPRDQDPDRVTLVAATDGHHGRVVARIARLLGVPAQIFVASGSPWDAYDGLWREHAVVTDVDGDYNAVAAAARRFARDHADNAVLIEHDASPGQEAMPEVSTPYSAVS